MSKLFIINAILALIYIVSVIYLTFNDYKVHRTKQVTKILNKLIKEENNNPNTENLIARTTTRTLLYTIALITAGIVLVQCIIESSTLNELLNDQRCTWSFITLTLVLYGNTSESNYLINQKK